MKIVLAADHAGFELKESLKNWLNELGYQTIDVGAKEFEQKDSYVKYAKLGIKKMQAATCKAIFICGSGVGMCIAANREKSIRAGGFTSVKGVKTSRQHNDINVLCLGGRVINFEKAKKLVNAFLKTDFEGGRHSVRISALDK